VLISVFMCSEFSVHTEMNVTDNISRQREASDICTVPDDLEIPDMDYNRISAMEKLQDLNDNMELNHSKAAADEKEQTSPSPRVKKSAHKARLAKSRTSNRTLRRSGTSGDEPLMQGFLEFRKKNKIVKFKKVWKSKFFTLIKGTLTYQEGLKIGESINLLGASVSTWKAYKAQKKVKSQKGDMSRLFDVSRERSHSGSSTGSSTNEVAIKLTESIEDRTFALVTMDSQVMFLRCASVADRDDWVGAISLVINELMKKYIPQEKDFGVTLKVVDHDRSPDLKFSFRLEAHIGDLSLKFWRTYEELESFHQEKVLKLMFDPSLAPEFKPYPESAFPIDEFMKGICTYFETISRIEVIATSAQFLAFIGTLRKNDVEAIPVEKVQEICQTGDIVLISKSRRIVALSKDDWDHIGIVIGKGSGKDQSFFLLEATKSEGFKLDPLNSRLQQLCEQGTTAFRKLDWSKERNLSVGVRISEFVKSIEAEKYSPSVLAKVNESSNISSQLVIECYILMGILPTNTRTAKAYSPGDFSGAAKNLPFVRGVFFEGEETLVSFKEIEVARSSVSRVTEEVKSTQSVQ
jgi:hypothetical protein